MNCISANKSIIRFEICIIHIWKHDKTYNHFYLTLKHNNVHFVKWVTASYFLLANPTLVRNMQFIYLYWYSNSFLSKLFKIKLPVIIIIIFRAEQNQLPLAVWRAERKFRAYWIMLKSNWLKQYDLYPQNALILNIDKLLRVFKQISKVRSENEIICLDVFKSIYFTRYSFPP